MTRSKTLWFAIATLLAIASIGFNFSGGEYGWQPTFFVLPALLAAAGLLFEKLWAAFLALAFLAISILVWSYLAYQTIGPNWPYENTLRTALSLVPGLALVFGCLTSMIFIVRFFQSAQR